MTSKELRSRWSQMLSRCEDYDHPQYHDYGGRGISVCEEWHDYETFYRWCVNNNYSKELQLDRIDVEGNYEPDNCRFVTRKENANNKRNNLFIEAFGERKTASQWLEDGRCVVLVGTLHRRLGLGWDVEEALITPVNEKISSHTKTPPNAKLYELDGEAKTAAAWSRDPRCVVSIKTLRNRLREGFDIERALTQPEGYQKGKLYEGHNVSHWFSDPRCVVGYGTLNRRLASGWSVEDALTTPPSKGGRKPKNSMIE